MSVAGGASLIRAITGSASSIAIAKPMFSVSALRIPAVLIPTSRPERSTSGPPELPGLIAASVWSRPVRSPFGPSIVRSSPETMPEVTVGPPRPAGKPIAITTSPSRSADERASSTGVRSLASTRTTARSRSGAVPITVPSSGFVWTPSLKATVIPVVPSTTWLFVRISPSRWRITPDASPSPPPNDVVWTLTREGRTRLTAAASEPARSGAAAVSVGVDSRTVTVCVAVVARRRLLVVAAAAAGEQRRRGDRERDQPHGSLGKVITATAAAASSSTRPPARNANVTSCFLSTLLTSEPILSYASRRSSTFSAS